MRTCWYFEVVCCTLIVPLLGKFQGVCVRVLLSLALWQNHPHTARWRQEHNSDGPNARSWCTSRRECFCLHTTAVTRPNLWHQRWCCWRWLCTSHSYGWGKLAVMECSIFRMHFMNSTWKDGSFRSPRSELRLRWVQSSHSFRNAVQQNRVVNSRKGPRCGLRPHQDWIFLCVHCQTWARVSRSHMHGQMFVAIF